MATRWRPDLTAVAVDEALTLLVAWRRGKNLEGRMVPIDRAVRAAIQSSCEETLNLLAEMHAVGYGPDVHVELNEYMAVPQHVVEDDAYDVLDLLERAASLERLSPADIPKTLWFYAVAVGNDPERRTSFVRKANPHRLARPGRILTTLGDVLARIEAPVFVLESRFDVVVVEGGLVVLNDNAFETMFRGATELQGRIPQWAKSISDHLPIEAGGAERLVEASKRDARLARRLRSISEADYIPNVTMAQLRAQIKAQGLDAGRLIRENQLVIDEEDPDTLLRLLNEDLFVGGLSGRKYAADRKRVR